MALEIEPVKVGATYTSDCCLTRAFRIAIAYGRVAVAIRNVRVKQWSLV